MPQYLIVGVHPPDLCPSANEKIRNLAAEGGKEMPALGEKLGVKILATYETGSVDFLSVISNFTLLLDYEMNHHEEALNFALALSRLEEMTGRALTD